LNNPLKIGALKQLRKLRIAYH